MLHALFVLIRSIMADRAVLAAENLPLRQQLAILEQRSKRPRLRNRDRMFWVCLSQIWTCWRSCLPVCQEPARK